MKIEQITEVGVAVRDLGKARRLFVELLGAEAGEVVTVERYGMRFCMCRLGKVDFELMEPTDEHGVLARFIKARGEGLHHIAFAVDDLAAWLSALETKGVSLIDRTPQDLLGGKVAFVHPSSFAGVMFELIQYPKAAALP